MAKPPHDDIRALDPEPDLASNWRYPNLDAVLRLGCAWNKDGQYAPPEMIEEALAMREEDTEHDREG